MRRRREAEAGDQELAELAALADGSLAPERRIALEAGVAGRRSLPTDSPSNSVPWRSPGQPRPRSTRRLHCAHGSMREQRRARRAHGTRRIVAIGAVATVAVAAVVGLSVFRSG